MRAQQETSTDHIRCCRLRVQDSLPDVQKTHHREPGDPYQHSCIELLLSLQDGDQRKGDPDASVVSEA